MKQFNNQQMHYQRLLAAQRAENAIEGEGKKSNYDK